MTAISKSWVTIADTSVDPDSPLDTTLMTALRDDLVHLREWLGASYTAGAVQNHNHDGANSELLEIGSNALRNGSFETGSNGWTMSNYSGGSNAVQTTGASHGKKCWAATSTVLANGGALARNNEFISVAAGEVVNVAAMLHASGANVAAAVVVEWFDGSDTQISYTTLINYTNTPTSASLVYGAAVAPATTRSYKVVLIGGVPASGSATGTVYFDGVFARGGLSLPYGAGTLYLPVPRINFNEAVTAVFEDTTGAYVEAFNARILVGGTYRTAWKHRTNNGAQQVTSRVYKNGAAFGTARNTTSLTYADATTEDLVFAAGDTVQLFVLSYTAGTIGGVSGFRLGISAMNALPAIPYLVPMVIGER